MFGVPTSELSSLCLSLYVGCLADSLARFYRCENITHLNMFCAQISPNCILPTHRRRFAGTLLASLAACSRVRNYPSGCQIDIV